MYNNPQGSYPSPQPEPQWDANADPTQNLYAAPPQNPAPQAQIGGTANFPQADFPQGSYPPTGQNFPPPAQWGATNFPQGSYPPTGQNFPPPAQWGATNPSQSSYPPTGQNFPPPAQWSATNPSQSSYSARNPAPAQNSFIYTGSPRRSGMIPAKGSQKSNLSMIMIGGATALALIVGLAFFVILSNHSQKSVTPVVQTVDTTPTTAADAATPTPDAAATPVSTPTLAPAPTAAIVATSVYNPPMAGQQPAPAPVQMPAPNPVPTATPVPASTPVPQTFTYDTNPVNGTLLTNPPANFCAAGQAVQSAGDQCTKDFSTNVSGYVVTCTDRLVSHAGGKGGCNTHGGEARRWYQHVVAK